MAQIRFTPHLREFFDLPQSFTAASTSLVELLGELDRRWPGLAFYLADERGHLRPHVAIWVDGRRIKDRKDLNIALPSDSEVHLLQALSGG